MEEERKYKQLIEQSVCKIMVSGAVCVTAFAISKIHLLSVGHAFESYDGFSLLTAEFVNGNSLQVKVLNHKYDHERGIDYAILEIAGDVDSQVNPLPISFPERASGKFISLGIGKLLSGFSDAEGSIIGNYFIQGSNSCEYLFKLSSGQAGQSGFSGAPIFALENNAVIAIQCEATIADIGAERDTVLAFPLKRLLDDPVMSRYRQQRPSIKERYFIENHLLPVFGRSLIGLEHSDNLDAYMRCIVVKLIPERDIRFTVFVAKNTNNTIIPAIRKHHQTRKMRYGIVGGMIRANVPVIYDFKNDKCYQLDLGGRGIESDVVNKKTRGAKERRIALLVAPIRNSAGEVVGVLSFDFFSVENPKKDVVEIITKSPSELGRILYLSESYAQTLSQLLLNHYEVDIDFSCIQPEDM
ncbi:serine protease [Oscillospiraceae bacterium 38-13]